MPVSSLFDRVLRAASTGDTRRLRAQMATVDPDSIRNEHGATPLMVACLRRNRAAARALVRQGVSVHLVDHDAQTALHYAVSVRSNHRIIADLPARHADIEAVDGMGRTALVEAAACGAESNVVELLRHGANVNAETGDSETPLSFAAVWNRLRVMRHFLRAGADVTWRGHCNTTVLWYAVQEGHSKAVSLLLRHGTDAGVAPDWDETMLEKAIWCGHHDLLRRLLGGFRDAATRERHVRRALDLARTIKDHAAAELLAKAPHGIAKT